MKENSCQYRAENVSLFSLIPLLVFPFKFQEKKNILDSTKNDSCRVFRSRSCRDTFALDFNYLCCAAARQISLQLGCVRFFELIQGQERDDTIGVSRRT